jgi:polar amino acid transport system permease protein
LISKVFRRLAPLAILAILLALVLPGRFAQQIGPASAAAVGPEPAPPVEAPASPPGAGPDFTLSVSPTAQTVAAGDRALYVVQVTGVEGFAQGVTLSVPRVPQRSIVRFPRNPVTPTTSAEFYLETTVASIPGAYTMTLAAEGPGGDPLHSSTFYLTISDESLYVRIVRFLFSGGAQSGVAVTLQITLGGIALALVIGLLVGLMRTSKNPFSLGFGTIYVEVIRGIPMLVLLFYVYFGLSDLIVRLAASVVGEGVVMPLEPVPAAILGLGLGYGAYMGETYRSGIQSIHHGQMEAARSLGMNYFQAMVYVILPQAIRRILPPLVNDMSAMLKDSALASALGVAEMARLTREFSSLTFRPFEAWTMAAVLYLIMTSVVSQLGRYLEKRMATD